MSHETEYVTRKGVALGQELMEDVELFFPSNSVDLRIVAVAMGTVLGSLIHQQQRDVKVRFTKKFFSALRKAADVPVEVVEIKQ